MGLPWTGVPLVGMSWVGVSNSGAGLLMTDNKLRGMMSRLLREINNNKKLLRKKIGKLSNVDITTVFPRK